MVKGLLEAEVVVSTETVRRRHMPVKPMAQPVASRSEGGGGGEGGRKCRRRREGDDGRGKCKSRASMARFMTHLMTAQTMMTTGVAEQRRRAWVRLQRGDGMRCRGQAARGGRGRRAHLVLSMLQLHVAKCRPRQAPLSMSGTQLRSKRRRVCGGQRCSCMRKGGSCIREVAVIRQQAFIICKKWEAEQNKEVCSRNAVTRRTGGGPFISANHMPPLLMLSTATTSTAYATANDDRGARLAGGAVADAVRNEELSDRVASDCGVKMRRVMRGAGAMCVCG